MPGVTSGEVFNLHGTVEVDPVPSLRSLKSIERGAQGLRSKLSAAFGSEVDNFTSSLSGSAGMLGRVASAAGPVGIGLAAVTGAAVAVSAGFVTVIQRGVELGSTFNDLSLKTGVSVETLSGLTSQLKQSGTDINAFASALFILEKNLGAAAGGSKELQATFAKLGIKDADKALADMDGTVRTVFKSLGDLKTAGERNVEGSKVMSKAFKDLSVFIADTGGDIDEVMRQAREAGTVMSGEVAGNLDALGDAWDRLTYKTSVMGANFAGTVAPEITKGLNDIDTALSSNLGAWQTWSLGVAIELARARGAMEGMAKWWRGNTWSPREMGRQVEESADAAEISAVSDYVFNKNNPTIPKARDGGIRIGGGGGGKSKKPKDLSSLYDQLRDAEAGRAIAGVTFDVTKYKAKLDAEQSVLDESLRQQLVSVQDYWHRRGTIELSGLESEIRLLQTQQKIATETYQAKYASIGADKNLSEKEKITKQEIEGAKWAKENLGLEGQLAQATERRGAALKLIPLHTAAASRELEKSMTALKADFMEAGGDSVGAAYARIADKFREMHEQARANKDAFPDADKWVSGLERAEKLAANLARLGDRADLTKGYLSLESAGIQGRIVDGVFSEREGRRQIYELELKYKQTLEGVLRESLAIAKALGDEKAVLAIKQQIEETERLAHVIDDARQRARGIFTDAATHGLDELSGGLKHAAATFGLDLLDGIRRVTQDNLVKRLGEAIFGKTDEFGADAGLAGKVLKKLGLSDLLGGAENAAQVANTTALTAASTTTTLNTAATTLNTVAMQGLTAALGAQAGADLFSGFASAFSFGGGGDFGGAGAGGGFATGGSFFVGGPGGTDKTPVGFWATKGERVDVLTPAQQRQRRGAVSVTINVHGVQSPQQFLSRETQSQIRRRYTQALMAAREWD